MECKICKKEFKNYNNSNRTRCGGCNTKIRRYRTKLAAVKYLGGKCERCGWSGEIAGFEFHHKNKEEKDFNIGMVANKRWELIKKELKKCELLCSICHRIEHSNIYPEFLDEVDNYRGRKLDF